MSAAADQRRLVRYAITALLVGVLAAYVAYLLRGVLLTLYVATLLAIGFSPAVSWIERRRFSEKRHRLPRWAAILLLYVGGLLFIALVLWLTLPPFITQVTELSRQLPDYLYRFETQLIEWGAISRRYTWQDILSKVQIESSGFAVAGVLGAVQNVLGAAGSIATVLLLPYYLLVEARTMQRGFVHMFRKSQRPIVGRLTADVTSKVGAWVSGQLLLGGVIGTTAAIGLWIIGVPYFYVLGLIAAIGELIPVIGPMLATIPAVFVGWTVSPNTALIVLAYFAVQQFIENNFLVPRIMSQQVGISAVTVLIALLVGTELFGVVGALLAVPTAAIVQVLVEELVSQDDEEE